MTDSLCVTVPLSESPATHQCVRCGRRTTIIGLKLSDLEPRAVHAADIIRYNEVAHEKS